MNTKSKPARRTSRKFDGHSWQELCQTTGLLRISFPVSARSLTLDNQSQGAGRIEEGEELLPSFLIFGTSVVLEACSALLRLIPSCGILVADCLGPLSNDGIIASNIIMPRMRQARFMAPKNIDNSFWFES